MKYNKIKYGNKWIKSQNMPEDTRKKFYCNNGDLNAYSFACGYIQMAESLDEKTKIRLFADHRHYHVRVYSSNERSPYEALPWDIFATYEGGLKAARKAYADYIKQYLIEGLKPCPN